MPSPPPPPPMGQRTQAVLFTLLQRMLTHHTAPEPTYHFENYEDGKPRWAPGVDNQRDYRDYRDSRRDQGRPRRRDDYDDARPPPPRGEGRPRRRRSPSTSSESDTPPRPRRSGRRDEPRRDEPRREEPRREEPRRDRRREHDSYDSYDEHYPPRRPRDDKRSGGYVSDDRHNRPRDDRDRRDRPRDDRDRRDRDRGDRRDDRYDDMFNSSSRRDPRRDDRDRRDRYDDRNRSGGRAVGKPGQPEWQRQAMTMFKEYALPVIKKEGQKYIARQMGGMGSKR